MKTILIDLVPCQYKLIAKITYHSSIQNKLNITNEIILIEIKYQCWSLIVAQWYTDIARSSWTQRALDITDGVCYLIGFHVAQLRLVF